MIEPKLPTPEFVGMKMISRFSVVIDYVFLDSSTTSSTPRGPHPAVAEQPRASTSSRHSSQRH